MTGRYAEQLMGVDGDDEGADGTQWTHSMRLDISSGVTHKQSSDKSGLCGQ